MDFENFVAENWNLLNLEEKDRLIVELQKREQACSDRIQPILKDLKDLEQREKLHLARHHQIYTLPIAEPMKLISAKKRSRASNKNSEHSDGTTPRELKARLDKCIKEEAALTAIEDILLHDKGLLEKCSFEQKHPTMTFTDDDSTNVPKLPQHLLLNVAKFMNPRIAAVCKELKDPQSDLVPVEVMELCQHSNHGVNCKIHLSDVRDQHQSRRKLFLSVFQLGAKECSSLIQRYKTKSRGEEAGLLEKDCPLLDRKTEYKFSAQYTDALSKKLRQFVPDLLKIKCCGGREDIRGLLTVLPEEWCEHFRKIHIKEYRLDSFYLLVSTLTCIELDLQSHRDVFKDPEMQMLIASTKYIEVFRVNCPLVPYNKLRTETNHSTLHDWTSHEDINDRIILQVASMSQLAPEGLKELVFTLPVEFETVLEFMEVAKLNSTCVVKLNFVGGNRKQMLDFEKKRSINWERKQAASREYYSCVYEPETGGRYELDFYGLDDRVWTITRIGPKSS